MQLDISFPTMNACMYAKSYMWIIDIALETLLPPLHFSRTILVYELMGPIHGWGTTFGTKELRTLSHWISTFIMI